MMTLDEAIKHCDEQAKKLKSNCVINIMDNNCAEEHEQLHDWLTDYKRLLDLNTPKKVGHITETEYESYWDDIGHDVVYPACPNCNRGIYDTSIVYCPDCGQKLDWSDSE